MTTKARPPRARTTLLVLLWIWAFCVFLTLDLFLNVPEFDRVRPRAPLYRSMRCVAHEMVGERYEEDDPFAAADAPPVRDAGEALADELPLLAQQDHRMDPAYWARLRQVVARLEDRLGEPALEPQIARLRGALGEVLHAAARPGAPYGGGADAFALAAAVGDESTWGLFLRAIRERETVIAKLPLTTGRDDLVFLDHALGAVVAKGTRPQRVALANEIADALRTEDDPDARRLWESYQARLQG